MMLLALRFPLLLYQLARTLEKNELKEFAGIVMLRMIMTNSKKTQGWCAMTW